jgi:hypothetical protein
MENDFYRELVSVSESPKGTYYITEKDEGKGYRTSRVDIKNGFVYEQKFGILRVDLSK